MTDTTTQQDTTELKRIVEAALFAADEPVGLSRLLALFPEQAQPTKDELKQVLKTLDEDYADRGIGLKKIGNGWRFQSQEALSPWLKQLFKGRTPRYSRALLETLSIIAYRQPVTRGDIEEIRGVSVSTETMRTLQERGWVKPVGHRDLPGRPALWGTTKKFLAYFNLDSLSGLPEIMEMRDTADIAAELNFSLPLDLEGHNEIESNDNQSTLAEVIPINPEEVDGNAAEDTPESIEDDERETP